MYPLLLVLLAFLSFPLSLFSQVEIPPAAIGHYSLAEDPRSLDPQAASDANSYRVIGAIYDTLLEYHPMNTVPYQVRPCILADLPKKEVSADGRHSYLCELKRDIRFHDDPCFPGGKGREIAAADVHYAFQRLCDPNVDSLVFPMLAEVVEGMAEARQRAEDKAAFSYDDNRVSGIEVLDPHRFRIRLRKPHPQILYWLALPCTAPVAREAIQAYPRKYPASLRADPAKPHPVGTGAFRLKEYIPGKHLHLERVANYRTSVFPSDSFPADNAEWLKPLAGKRLPLLDGIELTISAENVPLLAMFRRGELDEMPLNKDARTEIIGKDGQLSAKDRERGTILERDPDLSTFWIAFNLDDPTVGRNKKLRQALSSAYDPSAYVKQFSDGVSAVATQLLPPGVFGFEGERANPYGHDLEKAKRLLAEAGYPNGRDAESRQLEITLLAASPGPSIDDRAQFEAAMFERLGIKVRIEPTKFPALLQREEAGKFQLRAGAGWGADYPDPENFFMLFHSANVPPKGRNTTRYRNAEFDRLFEQMSAMENSPERLALIRKMNDLLAEDCPVIFTMHKHSQTVTQPWARRTLRNPLLEGGFKYLTVDPASRARLRKAWAE